MSYGGILRAACPPGQERLPDGRCASLRSPVPIYNLLGAETTAVEKAGKSFIRDLVRQAYREASESIVETDPVKARELFEKATATALGVTCPPGMIKTKSGCVQRTAEFPSARVRKSDLPEPGSLYFISSRNPFRRLAFSRLGHARLAQTSEELLVAQGQIASLVASEPTVYDAFVKWTINRAPDVVKQAWSVDAFQVNEALRTFSRNYAEKQNVVQAVSFGARWRDDLRGDMAYKRLKLGSSADEETYLGQYKESPGFYFDADKPENAAAVSLIASRGVVSFTIQAGNDLFGYVEALESQTWNLYLWYSHVYQSLQIFVPVLAKLYAETPNGKASDVYDALAIPNIPNPRGFVLWAVAANTFIFARMGDAGAQTLRGLLPDDLLNDSIKGFEDAITVNKAELFFFQKAAVAIDRDIQMFESIQFVLKVLALPLTAIANLPSLGGLLPWWGWALIGVGGLVVVGGTIYVLRG